MKIGGYSRFNGVTFFCHMFKIKGAVKKKHINYDIEWIIPPKWLRKLEGRFILGSLLTVYYQWKVLSKNIRNLFFILLIIYVAGFVIDLSFIDKYFNYYSKKFIIPFAIFILIVLILNYKKIIDIFKFHGAEHKVINCFIENGYVNLYLAKKAPKFNKRCGSNIASIFLVLYIPIWIFNIDSLIITFIIFLIAIQIAKVLSIKRFSGDKYIQILQHITVLEPSDEQLEVAINTFNQLQKIYYIYILEKHKVTNKK